MARKITHPRRGEIWLVNFDPTIGAEMKKTRPALVIQNDVGNRLSPITIVSPFANREATYPFPSSCRGEGEFDVDSVVTLNHILARSITRRLVGFDWEKFYPIGPWLRG